jgi:hypothetical protein
LLAGPALACPPQWYVDKTNYMHDHGYTEVNRTCWQDPEGNQHQINTTIVKRRSNLFGYEYGDMIEYYLITLDGKTIINGYEDLDYKHWQHTGNLADSPLFNLIGNPCCIGSAILAITMTLIGWQAKMRKDKPPEEK